MYQQCAVDVLCLVTLTIWHNLPIGFFPFSLFVLKLNKNHGLFVGNCIRHWLKCHFGSHEISSNNFPCFFCSSSLSSFDVSIWCWIHSNCRAAISQRHDSIEINLPKQLTHIYILNPLKNAHKCLICVGLFFSTLLCLKHSHASSVGLCSLCARIFQFFLWVWNNKFESESRGGKGELKIEIQK